MILFIYNTYNLCNSKVVFSEQVKWTLNGNKFTNKFKKQFFIKINLNGGKLKIRKWQR